MKHSKIDKYRQHSENDKHWSARRQFIKKHVKDYKGKALDKLLALSMVFSNHVFLGCRYDLELTDKVLEMAEGIDVGEMPSYELVPSAEAKRPHSPHQSEQPMRKIAKTKYSARLRFEPVHFVSSSSGTGETDEKENEEKPDHQSHNGTGLNNSHDNSPSSPSGFCKTEMNGHDSQPEHSSKDVASGGASELGNSRKKPTSDHTRVVDEEEEKEYSAGCEAHNGEQISQDSQSDGHGESGRSGGCDSRTNARTSDGSVLTPALKKKRRLISKLQSSLAVTLQDPAFENGPPNYSFILSQSFQACKTNPMYIFVNLKDIPPSDLPKKKKIPSEGYACELRCKGVYISTGYASCKNGAKEHVSKRAVRLFQRTVEVRVVQRQYNHNCVNDMVVCNVATSKPKLPPALFNSEDKLPPGTKSQNVPNKSKNWTDFVLTGNAHRATRMLRESAVFNGMKVNFTYDPVPDSSFWLCSVYFQDELVAQGKGTKKSSKRAAAEAAIRKLRKIQAANLEGGKEEEQEEEAQGQQHLSGGNHNSEPSSDHLGQQGRIKTKFSQFYILEKANNPVSILNDTAQFNEVSIEYKFTVLRGLSRRCEVYLDGQYVARGYGTLKTSRQMAAKKALAILKQTQTVVKSNDIKKGNSEAISRNQIIGRSEEESMFQEIKEDNIGNQLLRKMGWTGGGLGKKGEGIAEPIRVKKKFNRKGLGMVKDGQNQKLNKHSLKKIIFNYINSGSRDDLYFSTELSSVERQQIHLICKRNGLQSKSYGKGNARFLVVSHKFKKNQLINHLLKEGQVGRFELIKPQASQ